MPSIPPAARSFGPETVTLAILIPACVLMLAFFPRTPWTQKQAGHFTRTFTTTGAVALRVETGSGTIAVHSGAGSTVTIQATIYSRHPQSDADLIRQVEQNPPIHQMGNQIQIGPTPREWSRRLSISYDVSTPAGTSADVSTGSGDIRVDGLQGTVNADTGSGSVEASQLGQMLHANTGSGDISVRDVQGEARLQTGSGSINAHALSGAATLSTGSGDIVIDGGAQATRANTGSGSIRATGLHADFRARTGSGDITAQGVLPDGHRWDMGTGSGSIDLNLPSSTHAQVDLQTDSGSIHTDVPVQMVGKLNRQHITGIMGGVSATSNLTVHTGSGDIRIH